MAAPIGSPDDVSHSRISPRRQTVTTGRHEPSPVVAEGDSINIDDTFVLHGESQAMGLSPKAQVRTNEALEVRFAFWKLSQLREAEDSVGNLPLLAETETGIQGQCRGQFLGLTAH